MLILFDLPESEPTLCALVRCFFVMDIVYTYLICVSRVLTEFTLFTIVKVFSHSLTHVKLDIYPDLQPVNAPLYVCQNPLIIGA